jgi:peptide/nickel transport system substrate-binding protein
MQYHGQLAEKWEITNGGKEVTLYLRSGIKFHDGTPLNAQAVKATFDRYMNKDTGSPTSSLVGPYAGATVKDNLTVTIAFTDPNAPVMSNLARELTSILSPTAIEKQGLKYTDNPVGTGPFRFESWVRGQKITLVRNPDYSWPQKAYYTNKGPSYFDRFELRIIPDEETRVLALEKGEIHISNVPPHIAKRLKGNPNVTLLEAKNPGLWYLGMNCKKAPWNNPKLRQAVAHAINRQEIIDNGMEGYASPLYSPTAENVWGHHPGTKQVSPEFSPQAGKALIESLGYKMQANGIYAKGTTPLTMTLWTYNFQPYVRIAEIIQNQLKKIGVLVNINMMEQATLLANTNKGEHDGLLLASFWPDPDVLYYFFHSSRLATSNRIHYADKDMDRLLELGRQTVDLERRKGVYAEIQQKIVKEAAWVPLFTPIDIYGVHKSVTGVKRDPHGGLLLHDAKIN